ncbi:MULTISPECIES: beta-ketoacyl-[acyl-carrier-protein] synthase family protein [Sphingobacterium]|uniref:beta-ketoacyl-[acyl-carrier-protein] synthase family protein n=1 Tax=Sphingobacterium TaxID=28453 RepID=UPI00196A1115|nr:MULTISPECIES: beta-ketoacyl synthase N-terminal-like domain-containing protein [unclassified Sphingobacterium]
MYISTVNCVSPLGMDLESNWSALMEGESAIRTVDIGMLKSVPVACFVDPLSLMEDLSLSFLENLSLQAISPLLRDKIITARTGFVLSTTKGNIDKLGSTSIQEVELGRMGEILAHRFGFIAKPIVVSHACVSGLLAVSVAKRLIQMGQYDEILVLAADQVSEFVLSGFQSFQAMSSGPCRPFDAERDGVTLGEAVAAAWVTSHQAGSLVQILGEGAINDANHISGPSRTGEGLVRSVEAAFKEAGITNDSIDFISAHGTATLYNDEMEALAFNRLGLSGVPTHSLKGYYGHTLGASGLLELAISTKSLYENRLVATKGFTRLGTSKYLNIIQDSSSTALNCCLKTASGFGGSNTAMIIKKV